MPAGTECIILLHDHGPGVNIKVIELLDDGHGLGVADHLYLRISAYNLPQGGAVVRLHVVHHHVIQGTSL